MKTRIKTLFVTLLISTFSIAQTEYRTVNVPFASLDTVEGETLLSWTVAKEVNTSFFIIEASTDSGKSFTGMLTVKASGYSLQPTEFTVNKSELSDLNATYRITLVLMDGMRISSNELPTNTLQPFLLKTPLATK